ncbi:jg4696 [Pararge aegeria aegeria]|uniref:Jg4696 protein n=1 Tax=Pararge aegeria aegeria TaxID=348720 RepID=A0A8S4RCY2_9NEOP|nr:jg4696 [Pararge aegeria aegeria]
MGSEDRCYKEEDGRLVVFKIILQLQSLRGGSEAACFQAVLLMMFTRYFAAVAHDLGPAKEFDKRQAQEMKRHPVEARDKSGGTKTVFLPLY